MGYTVLGYTVLGYTVLGYTILGYTVQAALLSPFDAVGFSSSNRITGKKNISLCIME